MCSKFNCYLIKYFPKRTLKTIENNCISLKKLEINSKQHSYFQNFQSRKLQLDLPNFSAFHKWGIKFQIQVKNTITEIALRVFEFPSINMSNSPKHYKMFNYPTKLYVLTPVIWLKRSIIRNNRNEVKDEANSLESQQSKVGIDGTQHLPMPCPRKYKIVANWILLDGEREIYQKDKIDVLNRIKQKGKVITFSSYFDKGKRITLALWHHLVTKEISIFNLKINKITL